MLKNMKLGQKIGLGFGITIAIMLLIGVVSWTSLKKQSSLTDNASEAAWLTSQIFESQIDFERFLRTEDKDMLEESREETNAMKERSKKLIGNLTIQEQINDAKEVVELRVEWFGDFERFVEAFEKLDEKEASMVTSSNAAVAYIDESTTEMEQKLLNEIQEGKSLKDIEDRVQKSNRYKQLEVNMLSIRIQVLRFMKHHDTKSRDDAFKLFKESYELGGILKNSHSKQNDKDRVDSILNNMKKYEEAFAFYAKEVLTHDEQLAEMAEDGEQMVAVSRELQNDQELAMNKARSITNSVMTIFILGGFAAGVAFAIVITLGITGPINNVIDGLSSGSDSVASASDQVSSSSQSMAQGASEQAASLEEISSSLDEITSMTKQSSDNARSANVLMQEALTNTVAGKDAMDRLNGAIQDIRESTDKTSSVIKSIEEIAFQTNLLALNAAVEAARAGEAGKGFAVVAEEVRNLAQRAAEAAKDTTELIESSKRSAENGETLSAETGERIEAITDSAGKVATLVEEISTASHEQSTGIEQVNLAVNQMSEITQANAAGAEEFASASVELSSQSGSLKDIIGNLISVVHGRNQTKASHVKSSVQMRRPGQDMRQSEFSSRKPVPQISSAARSEEAIPFNDDFGEY